IVLNTNELLPEPETPVNTVSRRFGISTLMSLRLFTRAPCTRIRSWLSASCAAATVLLALLIVSPSVWASGRPAAVAHQLAIWQLVHLAPGLDTARGDSEPAVRRGQCTWVEAGARGEP